MQIRSNFFTKQAEAGIPISFGHISQYLIVGTVFFYNIKYILNGGGVAQFHGYRIARFSRSEGFFGFIVRGIPVNRLGKYF